MGLAREEQLLIQCSRVDMSDHQIADATALLRESLDWDYILETSITHAVAPLFFHGLSRVLQVMTPDNCVPEPILAELQKLSRGSRSRNRRLYRVLGDIAKAFQRAKIPVLGLKDIQLAREVYPDMALRPMGDVDILIHFSDYDKAAKCLAELGFVSLPSSDIPYTLKYAWGQHFCRPADGVWVDLQWNVLQMEWD